MATITMRGTEFSTNGELPRPGDDAPGFRLVSSELKDVALHDYAGKKKVLNIFPSIDTPTCATSVRTFNAHAAGRPDTVVLCISADLPFAQKRFCASEGLNNVQTLSLMRGRSFSDEYGLTIENGPLAGLTARAVVVIDADNKVVHSQLVREIADQPDYDAALKALG